MYDFYERMLCDFAMSSHKYDNACAFHLCSLNMFTSICGGVGLIRQISLWRGCEGGLPMIWTKWVMTKVLVSA